MIDGASWDPAKNDWLKRYRGISFEEVVQGRLLAVIENPNRPRQVLHLVLIDEYVWVVPAVEGPAGPFLKTIFPSRKYTKRWKAGIYEKDRS